MLIGLSNISNLLQNINFLFLPFLVAIFATFATVIVELIQLLHIGYCSNMPIRTNKLKPFLYFSLIGGPKKPVNASGSLNIHNVYSKFSKIENISLFVLRLHVGYQCFNSSSAFQKSRQGRP